MIFCSKCGGDNSDTAVYCRKCGAELEHEIETRVAPRPEAYRPPTAEPMIRAEIGGDADTDAEEAEIFAISPTLLFVKIGYGAAALGAILLVAITAALTSVSGLWAVLIGMLLFLIPAYYHVRQKLVKYTLTPSKLEIDQGFISRTTRNIPIRRIQDVTVTTSFYQRLLGFGDLVIDNASEDGGKVIMGNINTPSHYADVIMRQMRRLEK